MIPARGSIGSARLADPSWPSSPRASGLLSPLVLQLGLQVTQLLLELAGPSRQQCQVADVQGPGHAKGQPQPSQILFHLSTPFKSSERLDLTPQRINPLLKCLNTLPLAHKAPEYKG